MRLVFPDKFVFQSDNGLWIKNGVKSVVDNGGDYYPPRFFHDSAARAKFSITEVVEDPQPDSRYYNSNPDPANPGKWISTPIPINMLKPQLKAHAAALRWGRENAGVVVGTVNITTDETAQRKITELRRQAELNEIPLPVMFKTMSGWVSMDLLAIKAMYTKVAQLVQNSYLKEKEISDAIDAGTIATFEAVDAAFRTP